MMTRRLNGTEFAIATSQQPGNDIALLRPREHKKIFRAQLTSRIPVELLMTADFADVHVECSVRLAYRRRNALVLGSGG